MCMLRSLWVTLVGTQVGKVVGTWIDSGSSMTYPPRTEVSVGEMNIRGELLGSIF